MPRLALLLALIGSAAAAPRDEGDAEPAWFRCTCEAAAQPGCVCPSTSPPLSPPSSVPQFVIFTHDDALKQETHDALRAVLDGRSSSIGCKAAATLFTLARASNCSLLRQLYEEGYEVASHTLTHQKMNGWGRDEVEAEVVGGRADIARICGIPEEDIVGFRQPFLQSSPMVRKVLAGTKRFLYDSTLLEDPLGDSLSNGMEGRLWPYSMQDGIPQNCEEWSPAQSCDRGERHPGLFQVPVWDLASTGLFAGGVAMGGGGRDGGEGAVFNTLVGLLEAAYGGNRAPMPLYVHTGWLVANQGGVGRFVEYALSKPDVHLVTMRQLLAWMQRPVPSAQLTAAALGCGSRGGAPGPLTAAAASSSDGGVAASSKPAAAVAAAANAAQQAAATGATADAAQQAAAAGATAEAGAAQLPSSAPQLPPLAVQQPVATQDPQQEAAEAAAAAAAAAATVSADPSQDGSSSSGGGSGSNLAATVGGAVGGVLAAAALLCAAVLLRRRKRRVEEAAGGSCGSSGTPDGAQPSKYAGHLPADALAAVYVSGSDAAAADWKGGAAPPPMQQHAGPGVGGGGGGRLEADWELTEVVEQSGTPVSTRRRVKTAFN